MTQHRRKETTTDTSNESASIDAMLTRIASPVKVRPTKVKRKLPRTGTADRPVKVKKPAPPPVGKFNSRFFIKDVVDIVAAMKAANKIKALEPDNKELTRFEREVKRALPKSTQPNIKLIREFFLNDLAPLTVAIGAAVFQSKAVLKSTTGDDPDPTPFANFERMARTAVNLKMAQFLQDYLDLPESAVTLMLDSQQGARGVPPVRPSSPDFSMFTDAVSSLERAMTKAAKGARNGPVKG